MPRKFNYEYDNYDDGYDDYEDYDDYDYDHDVEGNGEATKFKPEASKPGIWRCSICTYDNDDCMSVCDICGVLRTPLVKFSGNGANTSDNLLDMKSSRVSSSVSEKNGTVDKSNAKKSDGAKALVPKDKPKALVPKDKQDSVDDSKYSKNEEVQVSTRSSESSSTVTSKDRHGNTDDSSHSNDVAVSNSLSDAYSSSGFPTNIAQPQICPSSTKNSTLSLSSGSSSSVNARRKNSNAQYKPEKWMLPDNAGDRLTQLNLAIVGHVDSGKSTLSGRLLFLLGRISQKEMHKYEKEAKLQGKGSFAYAWALDESAEERERGITMTVAVAYFDSKKYHVVVLDSPGHKDFVPNMISGATQSDAAILVIDASVGSFEVGMDSAKGQTREHAQLIRSFGIDQLIVAVNKMDSVQYSKDRFESIKLQLGTFLRTCSFKDSSVSWIPLSAIENQNLVAAPSDVQLSSWYQGPCLLDAIDSLQPPVRDFSKPLIMPICDVVKLQRGHVSACGKLEAGALRSGMKVLVMPFGDVGTVHSLDRDSQACAIARAGDNVGVSLQGIDASHVIAGGVLCHPDFPVAVSAHLELKVLVLDFAAPILIGSQLEFHIHHAKEAAKIVKMVSLLDTKTGKVTKKAPRCLTAKQRAVIEVALQGPVCVEEFSNCRALGRVFLRASGRTIAVGIVTRIIEDQE